MPSPVRVVVIVSCVAALIGCSDGFSRSEAVDAYLRANPEASTIEAACVVGRLVERYEPAPPDDDDLAGLEAQLTAEVADEQFELDQFRAEYHCGLTGEVERQLEREFAADGRDPEQASCLAAELGADLSDDELEVLLTGEMTDEFFGRFYDASVACNALP